MKNIKLLFILIALLQSYGISAQVSINTDGTTPDASAILDLKSTEKGMLIPRMSQTEIVNISNPANGLMVFNTTNNRLYLYDSSANEWKEIAIGTGTLTPVSWSCGDTLVDTRDGKSYATVQIGTQCWMAENLNIGTMISGSSNQTDNSTIEKYCYDDDTANCDTYGGLYQWDEMMQYVTTEGTHGICPVGWYLPTDAEWMTLEEEVESTTGVNWNTTGWRGTDAGGNLKETGTTHWNSPNTGATNSSGFTALPGGYRSSNTSFNNLNDTDHFWSSTQNNSQAWFRLLASNYTDSYRNDDSKTFGFYVRCIKE